MLRLAILLAVLGHFPAAAADWATVSAIFNDRCVKCHEGEYAPQGLSLDSHESILSGSWTGAVVEAKNPGESRLIQRVEGTLTPRMPLDGPPWLEEDQIAALRDWIANGAPGPLEDTPPPPEAPPTDPREDGLVTFDEVSRIFAQRCIECHSDNSKLGAPPEGLRLTSLDEILAGGDRVVVIPGNAAASALVRHIEGIASPRMPLDGPPFLTDEQIALIRDWIDGGASDEAGIAAPVPVGREIRIRGRMTAPDEIDGAAFTLTPSTRIDDRPGPGAAAELRARVGPSGDLVADRLRAR